MPCLVILGDSLTFHGPHGPVPLAEPRLFPNRLAARLPGGPWEVRVVARSGWGVREAWLALQRDVHLQQQVLPDADAVVFAIGSTDTLCVGVPRAAMAALPFVRPTSLRRQLRRGIDRHHHRLVRASGARLAHTPVPVYRHAWRKSVEALALFAPHAVRCAVRPARHMSPYYAGRQPHLPDIDAATLELAEAADVPLVDLPTLTARRLQELNPDGIHWSWPLHDEVASAFADQLVAHGAAGRAPAPAVERL